MNIIKGLHHVSLHTSDVNATIKFYTEVLGLKLLKKTVDFENTHAYHLYLGVGTGRQPGSIMSFFTGRENIAPDNDNIAVTAFKIPAKSINDWCEKLSALNIDCHAPHNRFNERVVSFKDPEGHCLELISTDDSLQAVDGTGAIEGIYSVTFAVPTFEKTGAVLTNFLDYKTINELGARIRFKNYHSESGNIIDIFTKSKEANSFDYQHIAFYAQNDNMLNIIREQLIDADIKVSDIKNQKYFHSFSFQEPGGYTFEVATAPDFTVDESPENLGRNLMLPEWLEPKRREIVASLPALEAS